MKTKAILGLGLMLMVCGCPQARKAEPLSARAADFAILSALAARVNESQTNWVVVVTDPTVRWSQWGGLKITSDGFKGTRLWQIRTNLETGEAEMKCTQVEAMGGYR